MKEQPQAFKLSAGGSLWLDLLRGLSAQAVVIGHGLFFCGLMNLETDPGIFVVQNFAVLLFFILSGFLITYSTAGKLVRTPGYGFSHFFIDRFSRIYTAFVPALVLVFLIDSWSIYLNAATYQYGAGYNPKTFVGNLLMLQDAPGVSLLLGRLTSFGSGRPFWTLSVEWWIYLCFGWLLLRVLRPARRRWYDALLLLPLLVIPAFNFWGGKGNGLMVTWLFGAVAYLLLAGHQLQKLRPQCYLAGALLFAALGALRFRETGQEYDVILAFAATGAVMTLLAYFQHTTWPRRLASAVRTNAAFSYTLYLLHYTVYDFLRSHLGDFFTPWTLLLAGFLLSNLLSLAVGLFFETKATRWVKNGLYRRFLPGA
ncbi:acyltransferase [Neolewinella lacunae]|uniref:Acyltransferase n=1 Tax=Neolewinella lacunae TaxID=1517758 RepID=A0A923PIW2_9BACT|nr:acyltransferase [Neolewinella lacunae]MBC6994124.1 acyltransferase [Neolewinella lacunae]MDN3636727.1 acyltransferase [Neolewinella lacunae]